MCDLSAKFGSDGLWLDKQNMGDYEDIVLYTVSRWLPDNMCHPRNNRSIEDWMNET